MGDDVAVDTVGVAGELLAKHWGYASLRPSQAKVIGYAAAGEDVIAVLPTSYGKSAMFQIPALMFEGCVLVVSPLISLMRDQVDDCVRRGIPAAYVNSTVSEHEQAARFARWVQGAYKLLYVAPERIRNARFREALALADVSFIVCDEAHCCSVWGHDFRPAYARIQTLTNALDPRPPVLAVTATATDDVVTDIAKAVGLRDGYRRVVADPVRPNLEFSVAPDAAWLRHFAEAWDLDAGRYVVYVTTKNMTVDYALLIQSWVGKDRCVGFYHGGLPAGQREGMQDDFKHGRLRVMVATSAFGMGIDIPDIRCVAHVGAPGSLEAYVQEGGRAGRDGLPSDVRLFPDPYAVSLQQRWVDDANPPYDAYGRVWRWLARTVRGDELLTMSDTAIADAVRGVNAYQVGAVLRCMSAHGLVQRTPVPYGVVAKADLVKLRKVAFGAVETTGSARDVARACWETLVLPETGGSPSVKYLEFGLDREAVSEASGVPLSFMSKAIDAVAAAGGWRTEAARYKNTTRLLMPGAKLADALPPEVIVAKLARDQGRLDAMVEYVNLPRGQHADYIRQYFLGDDGEVVA